MNKMFLTLLFLLISSTVGAQSRPNIILIYASDLGYGDTSAYGAKQLKTPNIDRLAREGLRFTDGHSTAALSTPSRYALLTGEYAWRKKGMGVLPGSAALVIEPERETLASMLKRGGYTTGVVGMWHLGLGSEGEPDWNGELKPGPNEVGFDYSFIITATGDRVPCVYIEDRRVVGLDLSDPIRVRYNAPVGDWPTGKGRPDLLKMHPSYGHDMTIVNGISRIGYMTGGAAALWKDEEMADVFTRKAVTFVERNRERPFFLYFAAHDPHVPRAPHPRFVGKSGMGPRGDTILQLDWCVGEILAALDRLKLAGNTLVIFTSDNGPALNDGYKDDAVEKLGDHRPAGPLRGGKYSNFEAGTRVPFLVRWPRRVKAGVSNALVSHIDLFASLSAFTGQKLNANAAPDSQDVLAALLGRSKTGRTHLVEQAGAISLRVGSWKYIEPSKRPKVMPETNTELGNDTVDQLYDLSSDVGETVNLTARYPERVQKMKVLLQQIRERK